MTNHVVPVTVQRELKRVLQMMRWLHPTLAKEVLRLAYAEAQKRETAKRTTMMARPDDPQGFLGFMPTEPTIVVDTEAIERRLMASLIDPTH